MIRKIELCRDLEQRDFIFDHRFVFEHSFDFRALITRYRGSACRQVANGSVVIAWQRSRYRFGNFPLDEAICVTIMLDREGTVRSILVDPKSHGGLGPFCDFHTLEKCMNRVLKGKNFSAFGRVCPTSGDVQCLHLFEVLGSAAGFYEEMSLRGLLNGSEQELMRIHPERGGLRVVNEHIALGKEHHTEMMLQSNAPTQFNSQKIPVKLDGRLRVRFASREPLEEQINAEDFRGVYGKLNRVLSKVHRLEKAALECRGRMRFTNYTSLTGLLLMAMSHSAMHILRGPRMLFILNYLQRGGERSTCIGFMSLAKKQSLIQCG